MFSPNPSKRLVLVADDEFLKRQDQVVKILVDENNRLRKAYKSKEQKARWS